MQESSTYQAILAEGEQRGRVSGHLEGERHLLIRQGTAKFGTPNILMRDQLEAITDAEELADLGVRLLTVTSWEDLLAPYKQNKRA
jgi:hypothetical protein